MNDLKANLQILPKAGEWG